MQMQRATRLRKAWAASGNPPCEHPTLDKEYHLGPDTGDVVRTKCAETWWHDDPNRPDRNR
jgi:hypothetical protein